MHIKMTRRYHFVPMRAFLIRVLGYETLMPLDQGEETFCIRLESKYFRLCKPYNFSWKRLQLCHCSVKEATDNKETENVTVFLKTMYTKIWISYNVHVSLLLFFFFSSITWTTTILGSKCGGLIWLKGLVCLALPKIPMIYHDFAFLLYI